MSLYINFFRVTDIETDEKIEHLNSKEVMERYGLRNRAHLRKVALQRKLLHDKYYIDYEADDEFWDAWREDWDYTRRKIARLCGYKL